MRRFSVVGVAVSLSVGPFAVQPASASFPGSAGRIAYEDFVGGGIEIFTMNADGSRRGPVTSTPKKFEQNPTWAPDGSKIAFNSFGTESSDIEIMNPDGSGRIKLMDTSDDEYSPAFSPDGSRIAFVRYMTSSGAELWAMDTDGTDQRQLTAGAKATSGIDWRSDGAAIVFTSETAEGDFALFQLDVASGDTTRLTAPGETGDDFNPEYSPDGASVAFLRFTEQDAVPVVVDIDGSNERILDHNSPTVNGLAWSPEGDTVALSEIGDPSEIALAPPDGSMGRTVLVNENAGELSWQACTDDCVITDKRSSVTEIFDSFRSPDGKRTTVVASIAPAFKGGPVRFEIYKRRDGEFRKFVSDEVAIDDNGNARVRFKVAEKGRCKAKAFFLGTTENEPSRDALKFPCMGFIVGGN